MLGELHRRCSNSKPAKKNNSSVVKQPLGTTMLRPIQSPSSQWSPVTNTIFQGYSIPTPSSNIHRCFNSGVWCLSEFTLCSRHLGWERVQAYQHTRNDLSSVGLPVLHRSHPGPRPPDIVGPISHPQSSDSSSFSLQLQCESEIPSHSRDPQYCGRPTFEGDIPVHDRMVSSSRVGAELFATHLNNKLDVFGSTFQHHLAWKVDPLSIS